MANPKPQPTKRFTRDGTSTIMTPKRALRAREINRPTREEINAATHTTTKRG